MTTIDLLWPEQAMLTLADSLPKEYLGIAVKETGSTTYFTLIMNPVFSTNCTLKENYFRLNEMFNSVPASAKHEFNWGLEIDIARFMMPKEVTGNVVRYLKRGAKK